MTTAQTDVEHPMRDQLIAILDRDRKWPDAPEAADAILAALPAMIAPLEWHSTTKGQVSEGKLHYFEIYENSAGTWTLDDGEAVYPCSCVPLAYEKAEEIHRATLMAAIGMGVK